MRRNNKLILAGAGIILLFSFIFLAKASDNQQVLQDELNNLTSELSSSGYSWLINYSIDYSAINDSVQVNVYEKDSNVLLATFGNISAPGWYKIFLTSLPDNYSQDVFDLKSLGDVEYDWVVDPSVTFMSGGVLVTLNSPLNNSNFNVPNVTFNVTSNDTLSWCGVSINGN